MHHCRASGTLGKAAGRETDIIENIQPFFMSDVPDDLFRR
jgi:hypothetical protein